MCGFQGRGAFIKQGEFVREGCLIQTYQLSQGGVNKIGEREGVY